MKERLRAVLDKPRRNTSPFDLASFLTALVWLTLIPSTTQVLTENPTFFQAHSVSPLSVGLILLVALLIGLLVLWAILAIIKRLASPHGYDQTASIITWLLAVGVLSIVAARIIGGVNPSILTWILAVLVIAIPLSLLLTVLVRQVTLGKVLLIAAGAVALLPLALTQVQGSTSESGITVTVADDAPSPPILLVIADELSYGTVQDDQGNVRPQYPNLKSLQLQSTTYTQAYATANATHLSVPSMLIGLADAREMPNLPGSLQTSGGPFTWLQPRYRSAIISPVISEQDQAAGIAMLPTGGNSGSSLDPVKAFQVLAADLAAVIGQSALPAPLSSTVPEVDDRWFDFWNLTPPESPVSDLPQLTAVLTDSKKPGIALWHTMLTHTPYQRDFEGQWWDGQDLGVTDLGLATENLIPLHRTMYAAAAQEFDRQLGSLFETLKASGTYDDTLIVVTADHGRTFSTQSPWRVGDTRDQRWGEVAHVPLFIKEQGQQTPTFVSAPRTLAQVGSTIMKETGSTVAGPQNPAPPLDEKPASAPSFWFDLRTGEAGFETLEPYSWPDAWDQSFLSPALPQSPFMDAEVIGKFGQPLPDNYTIVYSAEVVPDSGPAPVQPLVLDVDTAPCADLTEPGLVLTQGRVTGSVVWQEGNNLATRKAWGVIPVAEPSELQIACRVG